VPVAGTEKTQRIDLGLTLLSRVAVPGIAYTREEIAAWCGCTDSAIFLIEQKALQKLRRRLLCHKDQRLIECVEEMFHARQPAQRKEAA
jgi:hypothetical protein